MFRNEFTLIHQSTIKTNMENLYQFHLNTSNLIQITPPRIKVKIIDMPQPIQEGTEIKLKISHNYEGSRIWKIVIDRLDAPRTICDKAIKSPFKAFYHEHNFKKIDETHTLLEDKVTFSLPFYPLTLPILPLIRWDMQRMFTYRHQRTKELLETN